MKIYSVLRSQGLSPRFSRYLSKCAVASSTQAVPANVRKNLRRLGKLFHWCFIFFDVNDLQKKVQQRMLDF